MLCYNQNHKGLVYAAIEIPDKFGEKHFSYAYLYVCPGRMLTDNHFFYIKGNIGRVYAFFQNVNHYNVGEDMPLSIHVTDGGVYGMPWSFNGAVDRLLDNK